MPLTLPEQSETHIWQLRIPDFYTDRDRWFAWLSEDERTRAERFFRDEDRDRFILSRGGLRYLLANYLACTPETLVFTYSDYGKPSLLKPQTALSFNLAHSGEWVVYAIGYAPLLGIDVEQITSRTHLDGIIQRCLTPQEQTTLPSSPAEQLKGFLKYWTIKEAHLKAIGLGLSYPMTNVEITWQPEPVLTRPAQTDQIPSTQWTVKLWGPADDAIAAVCIGQTDTIVTMRPFLEAKP